MTGQCLFEPEQAVAVQDKVLGLPQEDNIKQIRNTLVCVLEIVKEYHATGSNLGKAFKALTTDYVDCLACNFMGEERTQLLKLILLCQLRTKNNEPAVRRALANIEVNTECRELVVRLNE